MLTLCRSAPIGDKRKYEENRIYTRTYHRQCRGGSAATGKILPGSSQQLHTQAWRYVSRDQTSKDSRADASRSRSRLIFRNLPPDITPASFQAKLTDPPQLQDVTVTDLKLVPHRRFAFVGFKSPEEAERVRAWLDGSYALGGGKVKVELVGDRPLAGKNRKATNVTTVQRGNEGNTDENGAGPSRLREFMDVMKGTDSSMPSGATKPDRKLKKKRKGDSPEPAKEADEDDDAAWLRRRQLDGVGRTDTSAEEPVRVSKNEGGSPLVAELQSDPDSQLILSTARLFLRNLPFITTSEDLSQLFEPFGETTEIHLPISGDKPLGTAFIRFREPQAALLAFQRLDGSTFQGRLLHILPGRVKPGEEERITGDVMESDVLGKRRDTHSDVKGRVESRRHDTSSKGVSWATLYMNVSGSILQCCMLNGVERRRRCFGCHSFGCRQGFSPYWLGQPGSPACARRDNCHQ